uniref:Uncharacterized protein n=1 Tax=Rhabditophanes sp. KR3021 TaxID=114890 RepID=A0AC35TPT1_9BILA
MDEDSISRCSSIKSRRSMKKESSVCIAYECEKAPILRKSSWNAEHSGSSTPKKKKFFVRKSAALILGSFRHHKTSNPDQGSCSSEPISGSKSARTSKSHLAIDIEKGLEVPSLNFSFSESELNMPDPALTLFHEIPHSPSTNKSSDHFQQQFAPLPRRSSHNSGITSLPKKTFQMAHASFRNRIDREMHGFETVFMTKKRAKDSKSSEFQGGDLNKYTSRSYAIQNGNEIFGNLLKLKTKTKYLLIITTFVLGVLVLPYEVQKLLHCQI